jgi:hypothetical protein
LGMNRTRVTTVDPAALSTVMKNKRVKAMTTPLAGTLHATLYIGKTRGRSPSLPRSTRFQRI